MAISGAQRRPLLELAVDDLIALDEIRARSSVGDESSLAKRVGGFRDDVYKDGKDLVRAEASTTRGGGRLICVAYPCRKRECVTNDLIGSSDRTKLVERRRAQNEAHELLRGQ